MKKNQHHIHRRTFIQYASLICAAGLTQAFNELRRYEKPRLSFSTLGCPTWDFEKIVKMATANGYQGIELRGIKGQLDLSKVPEFMPSNIQSTMKLMRDHKLSFVNLGSSVNLHIKDTTKRKLQMDEGKRYIELAATLQCPYIRVFPNELPKDQSREETTDLIVEGLRQLSDMASGTNVQVLMETHGEVVESDLLEMIMKKTDRKNVGLVWDMFNMWNVTQENPTSAYEKLKPFIRHTHIKDGKRNQGKVDYVFLGEGDFPMNEQLKLLKASNYKGFYSFEWEKLWHPEIADPELAIPDYAKKMETIWKKM